MKKSEAEQAISESPCPLCGCPPSALVYGEKPKRYYAVTCKKCHTTVTLSGWCKDWSTAVTTWIRYREIVKPR